VPLHPSALTPLRDYAAERERRYGTPGDGAAFFRTDRSDRVSYNAANSTFTVLRRQVGWTAIGRTRAPRVHDLRHRMVVRRIQAWHADNVDVDRKIAVLATYLGHVEVRDVYWYLSAVPKLMSIIADRFGTTVAVLQALNNLSNPDLLFVGQVLLVPLYCLPVRRYSAS